MLTELHLLRFSAFRLCIPLDVYIYNLDLVCPQKTLKETKICLSGSGVEMY